MFLEYLAGASKSPVNRFKHIGNSQKPLRIRPTFFRMTLANRQAFVGRALHCFEFSYQVVWEFYYPDLGEAFEYCKTQCTL